MWVWEIERQREKRSFFADRIFSRIAAYGKSKIGKRNRLTMSKSYTICNNQTKSSLVFR